MGNGWSDWLLGSDESFDVSKYLSNNNEYQVFYATLRHAVTQMNASEEPIQEEDQAEALMQLQIALAEWNREADHLYEWKSDFPCTLRITMEPELPQDPSPPQSEPRAMTSPTTLEETILSGISDNMTTTSEQMFQAIQRLEAKLQSQDRFLQVLAQYPRTARLYVMHTVYGHLDVDGAIRFHMINCEYAKAAYLIGKLAYGDPSLIKKYKRLQEMANCLRFQQSRLPSNDDTVAFDEAMTRFQLSLLEQQRQLEITMQVDALVGSSLMETIHKLLTLYPTKPDALLLAIQVGKQNAVHPRQFWWAMLKILSQTEQWQALFLVAAAARPAIGYVPLVEVFLDEDHPDLAQDLIAIIKDPIERQEIVNRLAKYEQERQELDEQQPVELTVERAAT